MVHKAAAASHLGERTGVLETSYGPSSISMTKDDGACTHFRHLFASTHWHSTGLPNWPDCPRMSHPKQGSESDARHTVLGVPENKNRSGRSLELGGVEGMGSGEVPHQLHSVLSQKGVLHVARSGHLVGDRAKARVTIAFAKRVDTWIRVWKTFGRFHAEVGMARQGGVGVRTTLIASTATDNRFAATCGGLDP